MDSATFRAYVLAMPLLPPEVRQALADAGDRLKEVDRVAIAQMLRDGLDEHARLLQEGVTQMEQLVKKGEKMVRSLREQDERSAEALPDFSSAA